MAKAKKKSSLPRKYNLMLIVREFNRDPVLMECARLVFDWANKAGLDGKRVTNLQFEFSDQDKIPLYGCTWVTCEGVKND